MAYGHGKNTALKIDNSGGTPVDLAAYFQSSSMPQVVESAETTGYQPTSDFRTKIAGLRDSTFEGSGPFNTVPDAQLESILGTIVTIEWGPIGSTIGNPKYTGEFLITEYEPVSPFDDTPTFTVSAEGTGAITAGTY